MHRIYYTCLNSAGEQCHGVRCAELWKGKGKRDTERKTEGVNKSSSTTDCNAWQECLFACHGRDIPINSRDVFKSIASTHIPQPTPLPSSSSARPSSHFETLILTISQQELFRTMGLRRRSSLPLSLRR